MLLLSTHRIKVRYPYWGDTEGLRGLLDWLAPPDDNDALPWRVEIWRRGTAPDDHEFELWEGE